MFKLKDKKTGNIVRKEENRFFFDKDKFCLIEENSEERIARLNKLLNSANNVKDLKQIIKELI